MPFLGFFTPKPSLVFCPDMWLIDRGMEILGQMVFFGFLDLKDHSPACC